MLLPSLIVFVSSSPVVVTVVPIVDREPPDVDGSATDEPIQSAVPRWIPRGQRYSDEDDDELARISDR